MSGKDEFWEAWDAAGALINTKPKLERPDWETYFLAIADAVSLRADCRRRSVGAVIVGPDRRIVSTGYNGGPPGGASCLAGECPRGMLTYEQVKEMSSYDTGPGRCIALHAEQNAIIHADWARLKGATLYSSQPPCDGCTKMIDGVGMTAVWRGQ